MVYVAAAAAVVGLLLSLLNFIQGGSQFIAESRQKKVERRQAEQARNLNELQTAFDAYKTIIAELRLTADRAEQRALIAEQKADAATVRLEECDRERDEMLRRLQRIENDRRSSS